MEPLDRGVLPTIDAVQTAMTRGGLSSSARDEARLERAYGRGDDYMSQSQAAQKEHELRIKRLAHQRPERGFSDAFEIPGNRGHSDKDVELSDDPRARLDRLREADRKDASDLTHESQRASSTEGEAQGR